MVQNKFLRAAFIALSFTLLQGCTKSGGGGGSTSAATVATPSSNSDNNNNGSTTEVTTDCGIVSNGKLQNPVNLEDGQLVSVDEVVSNNLVIINTTDENGIASKQLVKLHGVASGPANRTDAAISLMTQLSYSQTRFFQASKDCTTTVSGGGIGTIGQLVTSDGQSFGESVIKAGLADADTADACGGDKIGACMSALQGSEIEPMGEIDYFLWKPVSDTKGNVVVIHEIHCDAIAIVNGQTLEYKGGGNGRCGTYVGTKAGCAYGANVKVEILDKATGRPYTYQGKPYVNIPNGCNRVEVNPR